MKARSRAAETVTRCEGCFSFYGETPTKGLHTGHCNFAGVLYRAVQERAGRKLVDPVAKVVLR